MSTLFGNIDYINSSLVSQLKCLYNIYIYIKEIHEVQVKINQANDQKYIARNIYEILWIINQDGEKYLIFNFIKLLISRSLAIGDSWNSQYKLAFYL